MTASPAEIARYRPRWRQLAQEAMACAGDLDRPTGALKALAREREWVPPSADRADILAGGALKAVALAFEAESVKARRVALAPALAIFAAAVGDVLDATEPARDDRADAAAYAMRAYRADIDG